MIINILGTDYDFKKDDLNNPDLALNDGVCKTFDKEIIVRRKEYMDGNTEKGKTYRYNHVLRHELIHAVAEESGVSYGENEELVDWIAHIIPIINTKIAELVIADEKELKGE